MSIRCLVGLEALEYRLGILQYACVLAHDDLVVGNERAIIPLAVLIHGNVSLVCYVIAESEITPINILFCSHSCLLLLLIVFIIHHFSVVHSRTIILLYFLFFQCYYEFFCILVLNIFHITDPAVHRFPPGRVLY